MCASRIGIALLLLALTLAAGLGSVAAQTGGAIVVPPGTRLRATLGEAKAEVTVASSAEPIAVTFGRMEANRFVAYPPAQALPYDRPFLVELRFAGEPPFEETTVTVTTQKGRRHAVPAYKVAATPSVFLTPEMYFEDSTACGGLRFCPRD